VRREVALQGEVTALEFAVASVRQYIDALFPTGVIVGWTGDVTAIPDGWALCDGNQYVARDGSLVTAPDLTAEFIGSAPHYTLAYIMKL